MTSQVTLVVKNPSVLFENYLHYQFLRIKRFFIKKKKRIHLPMQETQETWVQSLGQEDLLA